MAECVKTGITRPHKMLTDGQWEFSDSLPRNVFVCVDKQGWAGLSVAITGHLSVRGVSCNSRTSCVFL